MRVNRMELTLQTVTITVDHQHCQLNTCFEVIHRLVPLTQLVCAALKKRSNFFRSWNPSYKFSLMIDDLLNNKLNEFTSSVLLILGMICKALFTIITQYVESRGCPWYQALFFTEWMFLISMILYWFILYSFAYFCCYKNKSNINRKVALSISDSDTLSRDSNSNSISSSNILPNTMTYCQALFSDFSSKNFTLKAWLILLARGFTGSFAGLFFVWSLEYIDSGDAILIQTVTVTIGNVLFGMLFFNEPKSKLIIFSLIICIIGLLLVCQPSFIFDKFEIKKGEHINYSEVSLFGFILVGISGIMRLGSGIVSKYAKQFNINWLQLCLMASFMSAITISIVVTIEYYFIHKNDKDSVFWWFDDYNVIYIIETLSIGCFVSLFVISYTIGFQYGNVSKLGILLNTDIIFAYILQIFILDEIENGLTYAGGAVVLLVCGVVFFVQWKHSNIESNSENLINNKVDHNNDEFQ